MSVLSVFQPKSRISYLDDGNRSTQLSIAFVLLFVVKCCCADRHRWHKSRPQCVINIFSEIFSGDKLNLFMQKRGLYKTRVFNFRGGERLCYESGCLLVQYSLFFVFFFFAQLRSQTIRIICIESTLSLSLCLKATPFMWHCIISKGPATTIYLSKKEINSRFYKSKRPQFLLPRMRAV